jgi:hypothetical protein
MTLQGLKSMIYHTRGEHTNNYTTEVVHTRTVHHIRRNTDIANPSFLQGHDAKGQEHYMYVQHKQHSQY